MPGTFYKTVNGTISMLAYRALLCMLRIQRPHLQEHNCNRQQNQFMFDDFVTDNGNFFSGNTNRIRFNVITVKPFYRALKFFKNIFRPMSHPVFLE